MQISSIFTTLLLHFCILDLSLSRNGPECDDNLFYAPYVKVRRKRNSGDLDSLEKTGFIDLSRYVNVILCVNGPAVILSNYEVVLNGTTKVHVFSNGTMKVYNHQCMKINKVPRDELDRLHAAHVLARITHDIKVVGVRAVGINLVGEALDYRKPTPAWFHRQNYEHEIRKDKIISDGSFAIIGPENTTFCLKVNQDFNVVLMSKAKSDNEICFWSIKNIDDRYERYKEIFRSNRTVFDYEWQDCPSPGRITTTPGPHPTTPTTTTPFPPLDPFAYIDPMGRRKPTVPTTTAAPTWPPTSRTPPPPAEIQVEYQVDLEICLPFPVTDKSECSPPPIPDRACELTDQVFLIEPKYLEEELKWKSRILELISELFGKICEPFPSDMAYTVNRVLEYYLALAHEKDVGNSPRFRRKQLDSWKILINDLQICNKKIVNHVWFDWIFQNSTDEDEVYFRRRRKRSFAHHYEIPQSRHGYWDSDTQIPKRFKRKMARKSHIITKSRKSSGNQKSHRTKRRNYDKNPMEFLEEMSYPISPRIKRSTLTTPTFTAFNSSFDEIRLHNHTLDPFNQESIRRVPIHKDYHFIGYPTDLHHVSHSNTTVRTSIFYYEDNAEVEYELNVAIDIAWKIWATVAGYCNQHYEKRESETFPRFYNTYYEEFLEPVEEDWKFPIDNEILKALLSGYNSDDNVKWLDTCLEASYMDSNTKTFRPPRPLIVGGERAALSKEANAFLEIPLEQYRRFHNVPAPVPMSNLGSSFHHRTLYKKAGEHQESIRRIAG